MPHNVDADQILRRARPITEQHGHEIQPFGHLVRMPIALDATICQESVDNLNQILGDTMTLRDMYKKLTGRGSRGCCTRMTSCCARREAWRGFDVPTLKASANSQEAEK